MTAAEVVMLGLVLAWSIAIVAMFEVMRRRMRRLRRSLASGREKVVALAARCDQIEKLIEEAKKMLITREGAEKLVKRVDLISQDMNKILQEWATFRNTAAARKIASGVLPKAKSDQSEST